MFDSDHPVSEDGREAEQAGIQSVEVGARVLGALASLTAVGAPPMLKTLAEHAGMPPAKAHRYVVSLMRSGLVEREPVTGRYRLGPKARQIGIVALQSMDVMRLGIQELPAVRDRIGHTVALAIWAYHGPTIILVEEVRTSIAVSAHVGQIMPLLSSATGRAFGAWGPDSQVRPMLMDELARGQGLRPASSIKSMAQAEGFVPIDPRARRRVGARRSQSLDQRAVRAGFRFSRRTGRGDFHAGGRPRSSTRIPRDD